MNYCTLQSKDLLWSGYIILETGSHCLASRLRVQNCLLDCLCRLLRKEGFGCCIGLTSHFLSSYCKSYVYRCVLGKQGMCERNSLCMMDRINSTVSILCSGYVHKYYSFFSGLGLFLAVVVCAFCWTLAVQGSSLLVHSTYPC